jgi:hypothetical protein
MKEKIKGILRFILRSVLFWSITVFVIVAAVIAIFSAIPSGYFDEPIKISPNEWNPDGWNG